MGKFWRDLAGVTMLRWLVLASAVVLIGGAAVACSSASKTTSATQPAEKQPGGGDPTATTPGAVLHLSLGDYSSSDFHGIMERLFSNPWTRENCTTFLARSDLEVGRTIEFESTKVNPAAPHLTPVAADEATAGLIAKDVCRQYQLTPTPKITP